MCIHNMELYLYVLTSANPKHTLLSDVILRRTTFSQPILFPLAAPVIRRDSLVRLWHYINALLTCVLNDLSLVPLQLHEVIVLIVVLCS